MIPDLTPIFQQYEALRAQTDAVFATVRSQFPQCVTCKEGCSDCCHALFDLSLVEAMYLNRAFQAHFGYGPERSAILERASETDRQLTRLKRDLFREEKAGKSAEDIMAEAARVKSRCPLLGEDDRCLLYEARPITCRIYGVPTSIAGKGHVCGFAAFEKGQSYPTVHLDKIQDRLADLSRAIADTVESRFKELHEVYVPLSMALLTRYDEAYLGIGPAKREE
ncbi:YkgJ family cysteine cluster protein [uncultured Desulfovibrio sp.]|uniref:YkgJ family cysteine cluster protein n=1 Tax=Candidatus Desulfovibrio intestinavium TaxID=2838534 RepID=A0A9D2HMZ6_9BACT|nr:YkgJ family cysteine cluster protein [uncultured Desulfovibrio sp.]HJA78709.1 YkgJ family cysteine cluster protein [Candidatus Desulfovibrio intestinavium]